MSRRTVKSNDIDTYKKIYKSMPQKELQEEFDALSDQVVAMLDTLDCSSVEVMYDGKDSLLMQFKEVHTRHLN